MHFPKIILLILGLAALLIVLNMFIREPKPPPIDTNLLLPDLQVLPPNQLFIEGVLGIKKIRFSTTIVNQGSGPLELIGKYNPETNKIQATQVIYTKDGKIETKEVGEFIFHPDHDHWHFERFNIFQLWTYKPDGSLDQLLASTEKTSFCIQDLEMTSPKVTRTPKAIVYDLCNQEKQGISVGWADKYEADVEGQELEITDLPDGEYAVLSRVDPDNLIEETNEGNNFSIAFILLENDQVLIQDKP